jgi:HPt (histidine-containing phosphotransfer) domain-containing protein
VREHDEDTKAAIAAIWDAAKPRLAARVAVLKAAVTAAQAGTLEEDERQHAAGEAHKLAGSLGTFGHTEASRLAREVEIALEGDGPFADLVTALAASVDLSEG